MALAAILASGCGSWAASLVVSQDSYIDGRDGFLDSNFGDATSVFASQSAGTLGGLKSYLLFDASALPEITSLGDFTVQRSGSSTVNRTIVLYAILGDNVDLWTESGITWNNAPGNNVAQGIRDFEAFAGESLIRIGNISTGTDPAAVYSVPFSALSATDYQSILDALNTGDRKLTLGLRYNSTQVSSISFRSREYGDGSSAAFLDVTLIPEPSSAALLSLAGLAGMMALRRRKSFRRPGPHECERIEARNLAMKTSNILPCLFAAAALGLLIPEALANPMTLPVVADSHIDGTNQTVNFGAEDVCVISQNEAGAHKAYLRFDASSWGTTNIERLGELRITAASDVSPRTYAAYVITGDNANDWTETGITWENAPANNVTGTVRDFVPFTGQAVTRLGTVSGGGVGTTLTIPITPGSVGEAELLNALNTGNRQATIGIRYNSSQNDAVGFYSREHGDGGQAATLAIFPIDRVIPTTMDSHIDWNFPDLNFGTASNLELSQDALGGKKAYLKFDASNFGEAQVTRVEKLLVYWSGSVNITRTLKFSVVTGTNTTTGVGVNDWTESEITWANAPANNTDTNRSIIAFPGETVTLIGTLAYTAGNPRDMNVLVQEGSAAEAALLTALNTGDRKVTIGVEYNSSQNNSVGIYSRERDDGIYTPTLWLNPPVTSPPTLRWYGFDAGQPVIELDGPANANYVIMVSTNLTDWSDVATQLVNTPPMLWTDTDAGAAPSRFYRARIE